MNARKFMKLASELTGFEVKGKRQFAGYASVYNSVNDRGFSILPGAYDEVIASGEKPLMFFNHDQYTVPIGKWLDLCSDEHGLKVVGELTEGNKQADQLYPALKHGSVNGLSVCIWFDSEAFENNTLSRVAELPEISIVSFPSDKAARITEALSADQEKIISQLKQEKDFEDFLRDVGGLSRERAKQFVSQFKQMSLQREAESTLNNPAVIESVNRLINLCKGNQYDS